MTMKIHAITYSMWAALLLLLVCCGGMGSRSAAKAEPEVARVVDVPEFNADSAYAYVARQVAFGPRVNTPANTPLAARLVQIEQDLMELLQQFKPDEVAIEELFFSKNITTGIAVAHARGVILATVEKAGIPLYEYTPMQVKQAVVGYGLAEKNQVMDMTKRLLKLRSVPKPDDAADALAIAICHARSATSLLRRVAPQGKETV